MSAAADAINVPRWERTEVEALRTRPTLSARLSPVVSRTTTMVFVCLGMSMVVVVVVGLFNYDIPVTQ